MVLQMLSSSLNRTIIGLKVLVDAPREGEIPNEAKTGTGPILLTCSFAYVRNWLNEHPFGNEPDARLICNRYTGGAIKPEAMWSMMKYLRSRILSLIKDVL